MIDLDKLPKVVVQLLDLADKIGLTDLVNTLWDILTGGIRFL